MRCRLGLPALAWAMVAAGAMGLSTCKKPIGSPPPSGIPDKLSLDSCDDARKKPDWITWDDVRWVDCDRPPVASKAEAFTLGEPVYVPLGPPAQDSRLYTPGNCDHGRRSITEHNLWYKPEHVGVAIACSRQRCEAKDRLGCLDLGVLHWDVDFYPAVKKNETVARAAFDAGCRLGDKRSCLFLEEVLEATGKPKEAAAARAAACKVDPPEPMACAEVGEHLQAEGRLEEAKVFLKRGCRGITHEPNAFQARRSGCGLLAQMAQTAGDEVSHREYLRLDCAYGHDSKSCQELGLALRREGDSKRAIPYLRKACGVLPDSHKFFHEACAALETSQ